MVSLVCKYVIYQQKLQNPSKGTPIKLCSLAQYTIMMRNVKVWGVFDKEFSRTEGYGKLVQQLNSLFDLKLPWVNRINNCVCESNYTVMFQIGLELKKL